MLKIEGVRLRPGDGSEILRRRCADILKIQEHDLLSCRVLRRSVDARENVHLVYTVAAEVRDEPQTLRRARSPHVSRYVPRS